MRKLEERMNVMIYVVMIIVAFAIGLKYCSKTDTKPKKSGSPHRKKRRSVWDDDPFFGTPLQKIK